MTSLPEIHLTRGRAGCLLAEQLQAIAIVVDALRASTTIAALLAYGVPRIQVVARVEDALALATQEEPGALLVGERGGERLPGFHLGNSPQEVFSTPTVSYPAAIFTSSNGAQRLTACLRAHRTLVGTVSNAASVIEWTRREAEATGRPVVLVAAGKHPDESYISPEDEATCTYLAARIGLPIAADSQELFAHWERELILHGLEEIFRHSTHARRLMEIGYCEDVLFCARTDTITTLPVVTGQVSLGGRVIGVEMEEMR